MPVGSTTRGRLCLDSRQRALAIAQAGDLDGSGTPVLFSSMVPVFSAFRRAIRRFHVWRTRSEVRSCCASTALHAALLVILGLITPAEPPEDGGTLAASFAVPGPPAVFDQLAPMPAEPAPAVSVTVSDTPFDSHAAAAAS